MGDRLSAARRTEGTEEMFGQEGMFKKGTFKRHESHTEKALKADAEIVKIDGIMPNRKMYDLWSRKNAELLLSDPENKKTFMLLLKTMAVMGIVPLLSFYVVFKSSQIVLGVTMDTALTLAGLTAVVMVNIVSIGYAYYAGWLEA